MNCACSKGSLKDPMTLCELHRIEFEKRLAAGAIAAPKKILPKYSVTAVVDRIELEDDHHCLHFQGDVFGGRLEGVKTAPAIGTKFSILFEAFE